MIPFLNPPPSSVSSATVGGIQVADAFALSLNIYAVSSPSDQALMRSQMAQVLADTYPDPEQRPFQVISSIVSPISFTLATTGRSKAAIRLIEFIGGLDLDTSGVPYGETVDGLRVIPQLLANVSQHVSWVESQASAPAPDSVEPVISTQAPVLASA